MNIYPLPKAPDLEIRAGDLDYGAVRDARVFWVTGTGLCADPSRTATLEALRIRAKSGITVFDMEYRPMFWPSREEARRWYEQVLPHVTVAVGNTDEALTAIAAGLGRTSAYTWLKLPAVEDMERVASATTLPVVPARR